MMYATFYPMHQAIRTPTGEWCCDSCGAPRFYNELTYLMEYPATMTDPEEGVLLCDNCGGETE